jgi:hypothetical protein
MSQPALDVGPQSIACLTCHNGVASTLVNYPGPGSDSTGKGNYYVDSSTFTTTLYVIGTDLSDDHPVGFQYVNTEDANNNAFPALVGQQVGATGMYVFDNAAAGANDDNFECATCHDVHNSVITTRAPVYFLRVSNEASAMCAACHVNKY